MDPQLIFPFCRKLFGLDSYDVELKDIDLDMDTDRKDMDIQKVIT